ncbi:MAG: DUF4252 domain-containing protein [Rikenellaceae bacterium]
MKRILLTISFSLIALCSIAQERSDFDSNKETISHFFKRYSDMKYITTIEIGPAMTKAMAVKLFEAGDDENAKILRSINSINILVETSEGKSHIKEAMFNLPKECSAYELITSTEKNDEISHFYFAEHPNGESCEFLMLMRKFDKRVVLYITGDFSITDISALSNLGQGIGGK